MTLVNICPEHGKLIRYTIEQMGPVIYVLFFTLVGARFQISLVPAMGLLGITYIILRSSGKFLGAWVGGTLSGAKTSVRDNLGFGLLSQAGVAIGLALASSRRFSALGEEGAILGALIINVITATTFIVQIIGRCLLNSQSNARVRSARRSIQRMIGPRRSKPIEVRSLVLILMIINHA